MNNTDTTKEIIDKIKTELPDIKKKYSIKSLGIFGSYIRNEQKNDSDLDMLIEFEDEAVITLIDFVQLENYLSDLLNNKVDLVMKKSLKPRIGKQILEEVLYL